MRSFFSLILMMACSTLCGQAPAESGAGVRFSEANELGQFRYLVEFEEPGLLRQIERTPGNRFDPAARDARTIRQELVARQALHRRNISNAVGRSLEVSHHYLATHSGFAVWLAPGEAENIARLSGVVSVERERLYQSSTQRGPWYIGADALWTGDSSPTGAELRGESMVLGILDTGIEVNHPSFANAPACGHGEGGVPDKLLSALDCSGTDAQGLCNNGPNPFDGNGHGSHVAGTAGGNRLDGDASPPPEPPGDTSEISGVAPCAHIRAYKVCPTNTCPGANILAGLNSVLLHGDVDVVNFSISGGTSPWQDNDRRKLDLVDAGIFVATAAGNTSPAVTDPVGQVNHRGPWVLSVAASSHDGVPGDIGLVSAAGPGEPPSETQEAGAVIGGASPPADPLVDFPLRRFDGQPEGFEGCTAGEEDAPIDLEPFPPAFFQGAAALIRRGNCSFTTKITNAHDAGAELVIVYNDEPGPLRMETLGKPDVPAYSIGLVAGAALRDFVATHPDAATIDFDPTPGDVLAGFSLRGPTPAPLDNLTKPDIAVPGVNIYAPVPLDFGGYGFISGTSMASPHAAGAAALVRQARPDWTPPEVMSAMMMTAHKVGRNDTGADAWNWDEVGSGRIDLTKAALAGLVMDETFDNYLAADPDTGGDVRTLNRPAVRDMDCTPRCTWTRTLRNTLDQPSNWVVDTRGDEMVVLVSPSSFSFNGDQDETVELTITAMPFGDQSTAGVFGEIVLTETGGLAPEQHITAVIRGEAPERPVAGVTPGSISTRLREGRATTETMTLINLGGGPDNLNWTIADSGADCAWPEWLSVTPTAGELIAGESVDTEVTIDTGILEIGQYQANLCVDSNDADNPRVNVPVVLTVIDATVGTLRGTVSGLGYCNASPEPLADATVTVTGQHNTFQATADRTGRYMFEIREDESPLTITVHSDGYQPGNELAAEIQAEATTVVDFELSLDAPCAVVAPAGTWLELERGQTNEVPLSIDNGDGNIALEWSLISGEIEPDEGVPADSSVDETFFLADFTVLPASNGGEPAMFTSPGGANTRGRVTGFSFRGTASGISDNPTNASDTCLVMQAPDGTTYAVGGVDATLPGCGQNVWNFQGEASDVDGTYQHAASALFDPPLTDLGEWRFTFVNDWDNSTFSSSTTWSDVSVTLHKTPLSPCIDPGQVEWLSVAPESGLAAPGGSESMTVMINSGQLQTGTHTAALCVQSNDPNASILVVPFTVTVTEGGSTSVIFSDRFQQ